MKNWRLVGALWLLLASSLVLGEVSPSKAADGDLILSGTPRVLEIATQNLIHGLSKKEPDFAPQDLKIKFEALVFPERIIPANSVENYLDHDTDWDRFEIEKNRLEDILGRRLDVRRRIIDNEQVDRLTQDFDEASKQLWPLYQQVTNGREAPEVEEKFLKPHRVYWDSMTNRQNLAKGALRFAMNSTLIGLTLHFVESMSPINAAILGTAGGGMSFFLMAGNDFYKSWLASQ